MVFLLIYWGVINFSCCAHDFRWKGSTISTLERVEIGISEVIKEGDTELFEFKVRVHELCKNVKLLDAAAAWGYCTRSIFFEKQFVSRYGLYEYNKL